MAAFTDLPLELLPHILCHIVKTSAIASLCLVNSLFLKYSRQFLYHSIFIYSWHKDSKRKIHQLFSTLAFSPLLAHHVVSIVIRHWPKGLSLDEQESLSAICRKGLSQCKRLVSCTWTRDGSLDTGLLQTLLDNTVLQELVLNGHHKSYYDPCILLGFTHLRKLTLLMPSVRVIEILPDWITSLRPTLRYFSIVCQVSPRLSEEIFLACFGKSNGRLEHLHLLGCSKITEKSLIQVLGANPNVQEIGLQALSPRFNMADFAYVQVSRSIAPNLRSITISLPPNIDSLIWFKQVQTLLRPCPIEEFQILKNGGDLVRGKTLDTAFVEDFVASHGNRLRKFAVQRLRIEAEAIGLVVCGCPFLEHLYVAVPRGRVHELGSYLGEAKNICTVHIFFPMEIPETLPVGMQTQVSPLLQRLDLGLKMNEVKELALQCGPRLREFGVGARVWQIERFVQKSGSGELEVLMDLAGYERPEIPDQFLALQS